jgi:UDP-N-acetylmuramate dehydrogenase
VTAHDSATTGLAALQACADELEHTLGAGRATTSAPLAPLTTFKVGGAADLLIEARSEAELVAIARVARAHALPVTPLGGGSNVLVGDGGVRGVVVLVRDRGLSREDASGVRAGAGVTARSAATAWRSLKPAATSRCEA